MNQSQYVQDIIHHKVVAVIRLNESDDARAVIRAIALGGIRIMEVTLTTPGALALIAELRNEQPELLIGAGSVLDVSMAEQCCRAGAQFLVSPVLRPELISIAHEAGVPACIGGFSPTELYMAQEAGADIVKVFPADSLGMKYFQSVKAPMPHLRLMPTGGVTLTNVGEWLRAGACAVGVGNALLDPAAIAAQQFDVLTANARTIFQSIELST